MQFLVTPELWTTTCTVFCPGLMKSCNASPLASSRRSQGEMNLQNTATVNFLPSNLSLGEAVQQVCGLRGRQ